MYIANLIKSGANVAVFIVNGYQKHGVIVEEAADHIILAGNKKDALIYKHAISTIEPV